MEKIKWLLDHDIRVGLRNWNLNTDFPGKYMVAEEHDDRHSQKDGDGGVWCIVGDDLEALVDDAYAFWVGVYAE